MIKTIRYLWRTCAPFQVIKAYFYQKLVIRKRLERIYANSIEKFRSFSSNLTLSSDWFTDSISCWLFVFEHYNFLSKTKLQCLEIGSWEGLSSFFILHHLQNATLTCVDTWSGSSGNNALMNKNNIDKSEQLFDKNLSCYKDRLIKYKGTSFSYFNTNSLPSQFNLIFIDGSHYSDDILTDAIKCFELLKIGGIMIFDDYTLKYYSRDLDNSAAGINCFLKLKKNFYKIVHVDKQLIIEKTAHIVGKIEAYYSDMDSIGLYSSIPPRK